MPIGAHLALLVISALLVARWRPVPSRALALAVGALVALPLPLVAIWPDEALITGTEGVVEAVTAGVLLALFVRGVRARAPWIALPAVVLLAEELDWGQLVFGFATPPWVAALGSRSDQLNFHNLDGLDWLWEPLPLVILLVLAGARGQVRAWADRLGLPLFAASLRWGVLALALFGVPTALFAGGRRFDEASELVMVLLVWTCWAQPSDQAPT